MNQLSYYNNEIDRILFDAVGSDVIVGEDLGNLVELVANTIYQYDQTESKSNLRKIVLLIICAKYKKCYIYDSESVLNQVSEKKKKKKADIDEDDNSISMDMADVGDDSEMKNNDIDKVNLSTAADLISHRHDYPYPKFREEKYLVRAKRIVEIKKIPQFEQKSIEWLNQRNECLTATAISVVLNEDPYKFPAEILLDKCGKGVPFVENENVHHGKKYEQIGTMWYAFRNNIKVAEYGLLQHQKYPFIGASPDGICEKEVLESDALSKMVGRLLEIKFPKTRKIVTGGAIDGDKCPHYYYLQVLTQLFVTGMDECDFLQCKIEEYDSWEDFVKDSNPKIPGLSKKTNLEKGCLIQLLPKSMVGGDPAMCLYNGKYLYPPKMHMSHEETEKWIASETMHFHTNELSKNYLIDRVIYWRLSQISCDLIKADHAYIKSRLPELKQFWDYVLFYRSQPKKLDRLVKLVGEIGHKKSAEIFEQVNKDYLSVNSSSKYQPLYQEENEWRKKFNKKSESYQKFLDYKKKFNKSVN